MIRVHSIFESISGEIGGFPQGSRAAFVRLGGCNLRCPYCDTPETQTSFKSDNYDVYKVYSTLINFGVDNIIITGGEPLLQSNEVILLCNLLINAGKLINIETNGTLPIPSAILNMAGVYIIMDYKLDLKYQVGFESNPINTHEIFNQLRSIDFIKFVVSDINEVERALLVQENMQSQGIEATFAYSPIILEKNFKPHNIFDLSRNILKLLQERRFNGVLNLQLHKFLEVD